MQNKDKYTIGKSPAAIYLMHILKENNDAHSFRIVSRILSHERKILNSLTNAHYAGSLDYTTFVSLVSRLRAGLASTLACNTLDPFYNNLINNILLAEYKRLINKFQSFYPKARTIVNAHQKPILPIDFISPLETTNEDRASKSSKYLERKGKINTLY